jgi:hypothetical protein
MRDLSLYRLYGIIQIMGEMGMRLAFNVKINDTILPPKNNFVIQFNLFQKAGKEKING